MEIGAVEHVVNSGAEAATVGAELFPQNDGTDHDVIKWLQAQEADTCCRGLVQQIRQWNGKASRAEMRALAQAQGIKL